MTAIGTILPGSIDGNERKAEVQGRQAECPHHAESGHDAELERGQSDQWRLRSALNRRQAVGRTEVLSMGVKRLGVPSGAAFKT